MTKEIVMYSRTSPCPFVTTAKRVLNDHALDYRELYIDKDDAARQRVLEWTGFLSVPTIIVAEAGELVPSEAPSPLARGASPRGVDRGIMITEPSFDELNQWLYKHGFITADALNRA
jgi:glutaredoxin